MARFFRWRFWYARSRFWRKKYRDAERKYVLLTLQAEAEVWRNRSREDTFASAAVLGARGMYGVAPRTGPAALPTKNAPLPQSFDPMAGLNGIEKMEFQSYWLPDARAAGVSEAVALNSFRAELAQRKSIRDEGNVN